MSPQVGKVCTWTKWHQVTRTITTLPLHGMPVWCKVTPLAFHQASLKNFPNQFVLLGKTQHCESKVSCPRTQHKHWSLPHNPSPWSQTQNQHLPDYSANVYKLMKTIYLNIASCMFCAITWSSTWIHSSPAPVAADLPSSIKKKQSVWPQRLILTSCTSMAGSLVSFLTSAKLRVDSWRSYRPARFLLVPNPLGFTATGQVDTKGFNRVKVTCRCYLGHHSLMKMG